MDFSTVRRGIVLILFPLTIKGFAYVHVPHSQSGAVPISSLLGVGQLGFWEIGKGGKIGEGWGK